jgi:DNA-binding CsgD family transcriptional regulator
MLEEIPVGDDEYLLLRRVSGSNHPRDSLTARELDVVRHARTGASNKEIAYMMDISASTVGVLLARARRKLARS